VGSAAYLAIVFGFMLWRGIEIEPQWVVLALFVIAIPLGRGRQFVIDWMPFLLLFFAYEVMRGFAGKTGIPPHDLAGWERSLFFGQLPTVGLQHALYEPAVISLLDWVTMGFYFLHFPLPLVVGFVFWTRQREHYLRFVAALLLMSFLAFVTYLFWPSAPPWWQDQAEIHKIINETVEKWDVEYYVSPIYANLNPNKFAAFPSLHAAYPALAAIYAWRRYRALGIALVGWTACVWFSIVYLGEHYVIDAIAGLAYAAVATALVELAVRRLPLSWRERMGIAVRPPTPSS
jgi:membrane-associated phospholipid phosphatase